MPHHCARTGLLVPVNASISTEAEEYYHPGMYDAVGCGHLVCARCGAVVRNAPGLVPHADRFDAEEAYAAPDPARLAYMHAGSRDTTDFRFYFCRCMNAIVGRVTALDAEPNDDDPRLPWACGGHPDATVPFNFCGVTIGSDTPFAELVERNLRGWAPDQARPLEKSNPGMWINRLYARLIDTGVEEALATAVSGFLASAEPALLGGALEFYIRYPRSVGAEKVAALWDAERDGRLAPGHPLAKNGETLAAYAAIVLARRAREGLEGVERLREAAVRPAARHIVSDLVQLDGAWLAANAVAIAKSGGFRTPIDMIYSANVTRSPHAGAALIALVDAGLVPLAEARGYARAVMAGDANVRAALEAR